MIYWFPLLDFFIAAVSNIVSYRRRIEHRLLSPPFRTSSLIAAVSNIVSNRRRLEHRLLSPPYRTSSLIAAVSNIVSYRRRIEHRLLSPPSRTSSLIADVSNIELRCHLLSLLLTNEEGSSSVSEINGHYIYVCI